uniref:Uncharacterized protein n=1 Tax=Ciona savignyi TaxID=51511 RepID=H2Z612_CIOSA
MHTGIVPISETPEKLPENHQESNENVVLGQQTVYVIVGCSVGLAALIFVVALVSYKRQHKIRDPEPCVCYVNSADTSRQGLLNDPETCDRVCVVREKMCADCDDDCPGSTYSF